MMRTILYPEPSEWERLVQRPAIERRMLDKPVIEIISRVKAEGDSALREFSKRFNNYEALEFRVDDNEIAEASGKISDELKEVINNAVCNISRFHSLKSNESEVTTTARGVKCWSRLLPIERVGLYVPGGTAPLFSTVLMLAIPAVKAGCREIIMCTPPDRNGRIDPLILYSASVTGVTSIYRIGGAQAIAAMAYGTETVPRVYKIFGPGNQYVTRAKELIQADGVAIDLPAGPSELLIIADRTADPGYVAADLLSQAEHGPDSQVVMLTDEMKIIEMVKLELNRQLARLKRKDIASSALEHSALILLDSINDCVSFSNMYAPEHLIIATADPYLLSAGVTSAGSVFLGRYSCESLGDYASGTNHTLPTNGYAKSYSGVSTESFMKKIFFQEVSAEGLSAIGPLVEIMAVAEQLDGHRNAVSIRLKESKDEKG